MKLSRLTQAVLREGWIVTLMISALSWPRSLFDPSLVSSCLVSAPLDDDGFQLPRFLLMMRETLVFWGEGGFY